MALTPFFRWQTTPMALNQQTRELREQAMIVSAIRQVIPKKRISVQDQDGDKIQAGVMCRYCQDLNFGFNSDIGLKNLFDAACRRISMIVSSVICLFYGINSEMTAGRFSLFGSYGP